MKPEGRGDGKKQRARRNAVAFRIKGIPFLFGRPDGDRRGQSGIKISLSASERYRAGKTCRPGERPDFL